MWQTWSNFGSILNGYQQFWLNKRRYCSEVQQVLVNVGSYERIERKMMLKMAREGKQTKYNDQRSLCSEEAIRGGQQKYDHCCDNWFDVFSSTTTAITRAHAEGRIVINKRGRSKLRWGSERSLDQKTFVDFSLFFILSYYFHTRLRHQPQTGARLTIAISHYG